ncbi:hypothetical protein POM88_052400 [Heracleum sosnowskyi]|uniref:PB1 domain-containing protein n=1 Tax=Heracleum sosnowskyi TaxID=360622 RepID=A0AAD8LWK5_9APIA|nr:hypothetical protein POM88_052400 [Heracleum sosnowskyi]
MSFLEVATMLEEAFGHLGYCEFSYKLPNVDGLNSISTDNDVLVMCTKLDLSRLVYVYAVTVNVEYTQEFQPSQQASLEYLDIPNVDGLDDEEIDVMLLENLAQQYDRVEEVEIEAVVSDVEEGSFHDDSSNVDSTDDENEDWDSCVVVHVDKSCNEAATTFAMSQLDAHGGLVEFDEAPGFLQSVLAEDLM